MSIPTLISTATASGAANVSFTSGIDSTYDEYMFVFTDLGPANDDSGFKFNGSTDSGSNYNVVKTTTLFRADSDTNFGYMTGDDLAQSTAFVALTFGIGNAADESGAGIMHLFSPASTTYVKHFYCRMTMHYHPSSEESIDHFVAGYFNTTSAVDAVQFKMSSGNFDGVIQMYGIA